jgi:hypothetical protein
MSDCVPCKALANCLEFIEFPKLPQTGKAYLSSAAALTVTCPNGNSVVVNLPSAAASFSIGYNLGQPPYPDLILNCTGGIIRVSVPDNITQSQLDSMIEGMLQTCMTQIAKSIGCVPGTFYNTQQSLGCPTNATATVVGSVPSPITGGVAIGVSSPANLLVVPAGVVQSTVSVADANGKAMQLLAELFSSGNVTCV